MSISNWLKTSVSIIKKDIAPTFWARTVITGNPKLREAKAEAEAEAETETSEQKLKPRRVKPPPQKCIEYMDSRAYNITYGEKPVWHTYVRNFKGVLPPKTRRNCWIAGKLKSSNPCPLCRDQYLLAHYKNIKLLKQFISPFGGFLLDSKKTGVCQKQQQRLEVAIQKAKNYGLLTFTVPHRSYDYSLYNKK